MHTVEQRGCFYRFRVRPFDPWDQDAKASELLAERQLFFGNPAAASVFLRNFAGDPFAVRGLQGILTRLDGAQPVHELADQWIERLALHLASRRVMVVEQVPKAPAGESVEGGPPTPQLPPPVPRRAESPPPVADPDPATFSSHADEEAQVQALVEAAKNGTPFCEECARAAAAAKAKEMADA